MANPELKIVRRFVDLARSSPWILIAIGLHVIIAAVMSVKYIHGELQKEKPPPTEIAVSLTPAPPVVIEPPAEPVRTKIPEDVPVELVPLEHELAFVPTEEDAPEDLFLDVGDPTGSEDSSESAPSSSSIGVGSGGQRGPGPSPFFFKGRPGGVNRPPKGRLPGGATLGTEEAVLEGLRWLLRHQNEDGSWSPSGLHMHCTDEPCIAPDPELDSSYDVGMTALSLLAFLGQGISVGSKVEIVDTAMGKRYQAGDVVKRGVKWLLARQKEEGSFSDGRPFEFPENETLSAMVLCEAYGLSRNRELKRPAQKALDFIVSAQKRNAAGERWGWGLGSYTDIEARYAAGEINDENYKALVEHVELPITCWVAMALRSAQSCGLTVEEEVVQGALKFALSLSDEVTNPESAPVVPADDKFVYHDSRPAIGMLIRSFVSQDLADPYLEKAAELLALDVPEIGKDGLSVHFYYWYFGTLALNQYDGPDSPRKGQGKFWDPWNDGLVKSLPPLQNDSKDKNDCARGGWLSDARGSQGGRALYNTALNVLTLQVYYRYGNVFGAAAKEPPAAPAPVGPSKPR